MTHKSAIGRVRRSDTVTQKREGSGDGFRSLARMKSIRYVSGGVTATHSLDGGAVSRASLCGVGHSDHLKYVTFSIPQKGRKHKHQLLIISG